MGHRHLSVKDFPKEKPAIRTYSVLPARAVQDGTLKHTTLRVLAAICIHTNAHGIAWPSLLTLARHIHMRPETVSRHVQRLVKMGYVRKLERKAYPMHIKRKSRGITNRYQVLFKGHDPLPTREQFDAPRPRVVEEPVGDSTQQGMTDQPGKDKRSGGLGDAESERGISTQASILASAFTKAVESVTGQPRAASHSLAMAQTLATNGVTAAQITDSTRALCRECLQKGRSSPKVIGQVAQWAGLGK